MSSVPTRTIYIGCGLALVLSVLWLHHEVLLGGMVYHMDDAADGYYPSHIAILRAYHDGVLPTWDRGSWCGWPLVADPYYGAFYPLTVLFALFGAVRGLGWQVAVHLAGGTVGMFCLLKRRKLDLGPALLGAIALGFSSFMTVRIRHVIFVQGMAWLPFILCGIEGWLQTRRGRELVLVATATGMALVCGALPLAPFFAIVVAAYVLPRLAREERRTLALAGVAAAALVGGLIAAAQIVPTVAHMPYSPRALGTDFTFASSYAWPDWTFLSTLILPDMYGTEDRALWFGPFNHWEMAGYYAGALVVLLAPLALGRARKRPELWALVAISLLAILLAFGGAVHGFFFRHVPLYAALRCPTRALVMLLAAAPILAAEAVTWLLDGERPRRPLAGGPIAIALMLLATAAWWILEHPRTPQPLPSMALRHAYGHLMLVLGAGGAILTLSFTGLAQAREAALGLALVTLIDLLSINRGYVQPKPADFAAGMERYTAVDWLLAQKPSNAIMDRFVPDPRGPFRLHNLGMVYGLEGAAGYDSVSVWHYVHFLYILNNGVPYPWPQLKDDLAAGDVKRYDTPLVDLLNVRWSISAHPPARDWLERFRPKPGDKPHARYEPVWDPQLAVYENPHVLPRAFVVYGAQVLPEDAAQARALPKLDPRKTVLLERAPEPAPVGDGRPFTPATLVHADRQHLTIDATPTAAGVLVVSETDYPGWSATVDGKPAPLLRADYAFRGVALPAGPHRIEMTYTARPVRLGLGLSLLGLVGLFGLGWGARRGRKRSTVL